jgi:hypothetical protein
MKINTRKNIVRIGRLSLTVLCAATFFCPLLAHKRITASEAENHIGERATVCGKVVNATYAASSQGQPTFLNLDEPDPYPVFTVVIWGADRPKFGGSRSIQLSKPGLVLWEPDRVKLGPPQAPEVAYRDKRICVTGRIESYRGVPEIVARSSKQIAVQSGPKK